MARVSGKYSMIKSRVIRAQVNRVLFIETSFHQCLRASPIVTNMLLTWQAKPVLTSEGYMFLSSI